MSKRPIVHPTKDEAFHECAAALNEDAVYETDRAVVVKGDSLELLKKLPADSVSLILTNPPYHTTKKANITKD